MGKNGVTLKIPPNTEHFAMFHHKAHVTFTKSKYGITTHNSSTPNAGSLDTNTILLQYIAAQHASSLTARLPAVDSPSTSSAQTGTVIPSSDFETETNPFPTIEEFFEKIHAEDPKQQGRNLPSIVASFTAEDVFCIDELQDYTAESLASTFKLSTGNAKYIYNEVRKEMRRIKRRLKAAAEHTTTN